MEKYYTTVIIGKAVVLWQYLLLNEGTSKMIPQSRLIDSKISILMYTVETESQSLVVWQRPFRSVVKP